MAKAAAKRKTVAERTAAAASAVTAPAPVATPAPAVDPTTMTAEEVMAAIAALQAQGVEAPTTPAPAATPEPEAPNTTPVGVASPKLTNGMPDFSTLTEGAPPAAATEVDWSKVAKSTETPFYDSATGTGPATADGPATQRVDDTPATPAPAPAASNTSIDIKGFMKEVAKLGADYGAGVNSLPALAMRVLEAYPQVPELSKTKASTILGAFNVASGKKAGIEHKSAAVQASKFNQFLEIAKRPDISAYDLMGKAISVIQEVAKRDKSPLRGSTYENMVSVARAQKGVQGRELTSAEIEAAIIPDKKERDPLEKLGDLFKSLRKAHDWAPASSKPGVEDAYHALEDAIKAAGGTVPEVKSDDE